VLSSPGKERHGHAGLSPPRVREVDERAWSISHEEKLRQLGVLPGEDKLMGILTVCVNT